MKRVLTIAGICLLYLTALAQPDLHPSFITLDLSPEGEAQFEEEVRNCDLLLKKLENKEEMTPDESLQVDRCFVEGGYWDAIGEGCSWYCGGGPDSVSASSYLPAGSQYSYEPRNAHDLNYKNAWVEGVPGNGIGEYLEYHFRPTSPRITQIKIANGYIKSEADWRKNGRVKTLKVYLDNQLLTTLHLADSRDLQLFDVEPIGKVRNNINYDSLSKTPGWVLKFEIAEVYPGEKYEDVVISELFFDGTDVHCLAMGTLITMADGTLKPIETIRIGDEVLSYNHTTKQNIPDEVMALAAPTHEDLIVIGFDDGTSLTCTADHPLFLADGTWVSGKPEHTSMYYNYNVVQQLQLGDTVKGNTNRKVTSIKTIPGAQQTYTIVRLKTYKTFYANRVLVGTEELKPVN